MPCIASADNDVYLATRRSTLPLVTFELLNLGAKSTGCASMRLYRRERYAAVSSSPGAPAPVTQSPQQGSHAGQATSDPPSSPHARARELIATLKKQSAQKAQANGAMASARGAVTPRRMAAVKHVEEVKTPRGGNTQTLYTI